MYSLKEAADATGRGKPAILKAIQKGRISAKKDDLGEWQIDPAELHRVYQPVSGKRFQNGQIERWETAEEILELRKELAVREEKLRFLEKHLSTVEAVNADLREDRDHWRRQATALLTHQEVREESREPAKQPEPRKTGLFGKLFGKSKKG